MNLHCTTLEQMTAINQNVHQKEKNAKLYTLIITIQQFNLYTTCINMVYSHNVKFKNYLLKDIYNMKYFEIYTI